MKRKMTVVFHDEDLYTNLKVEAVRRHVAASDIVAQAVQEWLASREAADLLPVIDAARNEWREKGGRLWADVERELETPTEGRGGRTGTKRVPG